MSIKTVKMANAYVGIKEGSLRDGSSNKGLVFERQAGSSYKTITHSGEIRSYTAAEIRHDFESGYLKPLLECF